MKTTEEMIAPKYNKDIFENAKFGDHFILNNNEECFFIGKVDMDLDDGLPQLYELIVHHHVRYVDGGEKDYTSNILAHPDGWVYDNLYVKPVNNDN